MTDSGHVVVVTTTDAEDKAHELAGAVIGARLAACAQVYPISSVYRWRGKVERDQEWRIDFKTRADLVEPLTRYVTEHHDYDEPEVVALPITGGSADYLNWVTDETTR
ncbi:divalent-cation tolerance protein CutA [Streptomyces durbertensis]|uniref:Divalent-cation tolerance protein CutA n=1 Tax=Streptomyces durbertensis TaxID=2448886 RepID=A0ABR6EC67_9ACTN|nr:divalent-cation tolerance protein CutA [Streptomyces durbertensis]MBB1242930.1 divalent-cation tolerance protein CutA [Streptomyces durbertensis]